MQSSNLSRQVIHVELLGFEDFEGLGAVMLLIEDLYKDIFPAA
jgi:hypothetical protein